MSTDSRNGPLESRERRKMTVEEGLSLLPGPDGERFVSLFEHGSLTVEMVAPPSRVPLPPHTRDEAYVIVRGSGELISGGVRVRVAPGDFCLFQRECRTTSRIFPTI